MNKENIEALLKDYQCPYMGTDLVSGNAIKEVKVEGNNVYVKCVLGWPAEGIMQAFHENMDKKIKEAYPDAQTNLDLSYEISAHGVQQSVERIKGIKNIIAVASGKGGVGKSTTAVNLALALKEEGATAAILDADIYGPSIPRMLGVSGQPDSEDGKTLEPKIGHGLQSMSIGLLVEEDTPMIWRGPMVTQALEQLLTDTNWKDVDYLIIDLPPGTGDVQLTLSQSLKLKGAIQEPTSTPITNPKIAVINPPVLKFILSGIRFARSYAGGIKLATIFIPTVAAKNAKAAINVKSKLSTLATISVG